MNRIFSSNTFILFDDGYDGCWLVDIGDYERAIEALPQGKTICGLLLTHAHFDHIYGINELCRNHPQCVVYVSSFDSKALMDDKQNLSRYHEHPIIFEGMHMEVIGEGDTIPLMGSTSIHVIATPGHEPGCITFYADDYIFTGDSYIPGEKVVTKLPGGNRQEAAESVSKILLLAEGKTICPGHGKMIIQ